MNARDPVQIALILDAEATTPIDEVIGRLPERDDAPLRFLLSRHGGGNLVRGQPIDWRRQAEAVSRLVSEVQRAAPTDGQPAELHVWGQAPLPLYVQLGQELSGWPTQLTFYSRRGDGGWDELPILSSSPAEARSFFDVRTDLDGLAPAEEGLICVFISSRGGQADPALIDRFLRTIGDKRGQLVEWRSSAPRSLGREDVEEAAAELRQLLVVALPQRFPRARLALFVAGPAALGFLVGWSLPQDRYQPDIPVPHFAGLAYEPALVIARRAQDWKQLPAPPSDHPDRAALWQAEQSLALIERLRSESKDEALLAQLDMHRQTLRRVAAFLYDLSHDVAFIGRIGVGKTTALCCLFDLLLEGQEGSESRVLFATGTGKTTLPEVRIKAGLSYALTIEPYSPEEIFTFIGELCEELIPSARSATAPREQEILSEEVRRALINMARLEEQKSKGADGRLVRHDPLAALVREIGDNQDRLRAELLSRIDVSQRSRLEISYEEAPLNKAPKVWLREKFASINYGREPSFSLPRTIEVQVPHGGLRSGAFALRIIDTRGIDKEEQRRDLQDRLDHPRTLVVLCSGFKDAPDLACQSVIQGALATRTEPKLADRMLLLVLAQGREALSTKDRGGNDPLSVDEGYDNKRVQIESALRDAPALDIAFYDAVADSPVAVHQQILRRLQAMRAVHSERIGGLAQLTDDLAATHSAEVAGRKQRARQRIVLDLKQYIDQARQLPPRQEDLTGPLQRALEHPHQRTLWATTRRNGTWPKLDVYYLLSRGVIADARRRCTAALVPLVGLIHQWHRDPDLVSERGFCDELKGNLAFWQDRYVLSAQRDGDALFRATMQNDLELWSRCRNAYGSVTGFTSYVRSQLLSWLAQREQDHVTRLEGRLDEAWQDQILKHLKDLAAASTPAPSLNGSGLASP